MRHDAVFAVSVLQCSAAGAALDAGVPATGHSPDGGWGALHFVLAAELAGADFDPAIWEGVAGLFLRTDAAASGAHWNEGVFAGGPARSGVTRPTHK